MSDSEEIGDGKQSDWEIKHADAWVDFEVKEIPNHFRITNRCNH